MEEPLLQLFNQVLKEETISTHWKKSDVILLHKKEEYLLAHKFNIQHLRTQNVF